MGTYENTYNQVIENAAKLPKTLLSSITAPEAIYEPPAYAEAHIRVMIMGDWIGRNLAFMSMRSKLQIARHSGGSSIGFPKA